MNSFKLYINGVISYLLIQSSIEPHILDNILNNIEDSTYALTSVKYKSIEGKDYELLEFNYQYDGDNFLAILRDNFTDNEHNRIDNLTI